MTAPARRSGRIGAIEAVLRRGGRVRSLGIDDSPFERGGEPDVLVVGAVYGGSRFEGLLSTRVEQDGHDATDRLIEMIQPSKFRPQLHLVLLDGVTLGGFNVVDLPRLSDEIDLPCVAVIRRKPNMERVERALSNLPRADERLRAMRRAGSVHPCHDVYFQASGLPPELARDLIGELAKNGNIPESLRAAHLIGKGIVTGESGHRA